MDILKYIIFIWKQNQYNYMYIIVMDSDEEWWGEVVVGLGQGRVETKRPCPLYSCKWYTWFII